MMALAVGRAFAFRTRRAWFLLGNPMLWIALAGVVMLVGIVVRQRAVRFLGAFLRTHVTLPEDHRLITDGPYARLRHPSDTGGLMSCVAVGNAFGSAASLLAMLVLPFAAFAYRIRVEERAPRRISVTRGDATAPGLPR